MKPIVPMFRPDLFSRLRDIAKKQVLANLKPIVPRGALGRGEGSVAEMQDLGTRARASFLMCPNWDCLDKAGIRGSGHMGIRNHSLSCSLKEAGLA